MKKTIGILAHVDAGKTTFSEQILYHAHALRACGRVDHKDAFMDSHPIERERGITIFSDQACFDYDGDTWYLVDTPGHADFSSEMERALSVMDYAVVVVSAVEGVQSHTETVWRLLERYQVPAFVFLNKIDRAGADADAVIARIRERLSSDALDLRNSFSADGTLKGEAIEAVAGGDEALLERYFTDGYDRDAFLESLRRQVRERRAFPLMAGSALRGEGIEDFLNMLSLLTPTDYERHENEPLQARAAKVRYDAQGSRMVFLKLTAGTLQARGEIDTPQGRMKVSELRIYSGAKFRQVSEARAGDLVAAAGLAGVTPGDRLGARCEKSRFVLTPLLTARVRYPREVQKTRMLEIMRRLEDEEPMLGVQWNAETGSIELQVMGAIQLEILRELVRTRYGIDIDFGACRVAYRETIASPACGIGHFEPLRHYAEVHVRLEPGARGSGITFESACHVDDLALNWQRLIRTHVFEYAHSGVLIGAPLTDVKVVLLAGRAHLKHTEGGDFREATYRAIRNALMYADSVLLEPICRFELRAPAENIGTILGDLTAMHAEYDSPVFEHDDIVVKGSVAFSRLSGYPEKLTALTHGRGWCAWQSDHYAPCENAAAIIEERQYNPQWETPDSIFCARGAGFNVAWDKVKDFAHVHSEANP